jgi:hypothetical protein
MVWWAAEGCAQVSLGTNSKRVCVDTQEIGADKAAMNDNRACVIANEAVRLLCSE